MLKSTRIMPKKWREVLVTQSSPSATPWSVTHQAPCPWDSPSKSTGVGCHSLLQKIFPIQGSNPGLLHCRQIFFSLSWEDPLAKGVAAHSSTLSWRLPWTEEPGGLQPMGSPRVRHNWMPNAQAKEPAIKKQFFITRYYFTLIWMAITKQTNKSPQIRKH